MRGVRGVRDCVGAFVHAWVRGVRGVHLCVGACVCTRQGLATLLGHKTLDALEPSWGVMDRFVSGDLEVGPRACCA